MNAGGESLGFGDACKKLAEHRGFVGGETGDNRAVVLTGNSTDRLDCRSTGIGKMDRIAPPIIRHASALDKPALLELVEKDDKAARENRELCAELLLADPFLCAQHAEDACVRWRQLQFLKPPGKERRGMRADLRE
jgi:hypothetical protein